jgi:hypothetical protein
MDEQRERQAERWRTTTRAAAIVGVGALVAVAAAQGWLAALWPW